MQSITEKAFFVIDINCYTCSGYAPLLHPFMYYDVYAIMSIVNEFHTPEGRENLFQKV